MGKYVKENEVVQCVEYHNFLQEIKEKIENTVDWMRNDVATVPDCVCDDVNELVNIMEGIQDKLIIEGKRKINRN